MKPEETRELNETKKYLSIWEAMPDKKLIDRIEEMNGELQYLQDAIGAAETELYYRNNPDIRLKLNPIKEEGRE